MLLPEKKAYIRILDEVNVNIAGVQPKDVEYLYERFGFFEEGYRFRRTFLLGQWDGKARFYTKTGKTYFHLLPTIIPILKTLGYKLELTDNRKFFNIDIPPIDKHFFNAYPDPMDASLPLELGAHQVDGVNKVIANNGGIIRAGTGAGKTVMCACIAKLYEDHNKYKVLVIVPTSDLVIQTRANIAEYGLDVGIYSGDEKDIEHQHVVSTWQSLQNNKTIATLFNVIIVDECHGAKATVIREVINDYAGNAPIKIGLTGTLPVNECDLMKVTVSLGTVIYTVTVVDLIASGWLAKLYLKMYQLTEDLQEQWKKYCEEFPEEVAKKKLTYIKFKETFLPDHKAEMAYLHANETRNAFIVNIIEIAREVRGNCLLLVEGIQYGKKLASMIPNAHFIYGKDHAKARKEIYALYDQHDDIIVVTSFKIASTGIDIKRIFNLFLLDAGKSFIKIIQSIGRGLRKGRDKNAVYVYDIGSDLGASKRHTTERKSIYKKENYAFTLEKVDYSNINS